MWEWISLVPWVIQEIGLSRNTTLCVTLIPEEWFFQLPSSFSLSIPIFWISYQKKRRKKTFEGPSSILVQMGLYHTSTNLLMKFVLPRKDPRFITHVWGCCWKSEHCAQRSGSHGTHMIKWIVKLILITRLKVNFLSGPICFLLIEPLLFIFIILIKRLCLNIFLLLCSISLQLNNFSFYHISYLWCI